MIHNKRVKYYSHLRLGTQPNDGRLGQNINNSYLFIYLYLSTSLFDSIRNLFGGRHAVFYLPTYASMMKSTKQARHI